MNRSLKTKLFAFGSTGLFFLVGFAIVGAKFYFDQRHEAEINPSSVQQEAKIPQLPNYKMRAVWEDKASDAWGSVDFNSLKENKVNVVFLNIQEGIENGNLESNAYQKAIESYIQSAASAGIAVYAWGPAGNMMDTYLFTVKYNQTHGSAKFSGLQFVIPDTETYSDQFVSYLNALDSLVSQLQGKESNLLEDQLLLALAIPYWFDGEKGTQTQVVWQGETKNLFNHFVNRLNRLQRSYLVVRTNRTVHDGDDGIIKHVKYEVDFTTKYTPRVSVVVGLSALMNASDVESFANKDRAALVKAAVNTGDGLAIYSSFTGVAVDDLDGFQAVMQKK